MIIYILMLLWVPFVYFIYAANRRTKSVAAGAVEPPEENKKFPLIYALLIFGFFTFWIGMRGYIFDTSAYIGSFNGLSSVFSEAWADIEWDGKHPGFDVFNVFFKCFVSQDYQWWLMTIAIISMLPIMLTLKKYSSDFFFSAFMFIALNTYTWPMNGMRQFICVAILFGCSAFVKDGKIIKFIAIVWLLSTIHYTSLLMIPVYFVARSKPWRLKIAAFILLIVVICFFAEPVFAGLEDNVLSGTAYEGVTSQFEHDDGVNPLRALFSCVFPVLAYIKRDSLEEASLGNSMIPVAVNMSLVAAALNVVGVFTSGILIGRLPIYCSVYNMLLIPYIFKYGFVNRDRTVVRTVLVCMMIVMFYMECPKTYHSDLTGWIS